MFVVLVPYSCTAYIILIPALGRQRMSGRAVQLKVQP